MFIYVILVFVEKTITANLKVIEIQSYCVLISHQSSALLPAGFIKNSGS